MRTKLIALPLVLLLLTSLASPFTVMASPNQAASSMAVVGQMGGVTNVMDYSSGQLYSNVGPRLLRMAVSSSAPGAPTKPPTWGGLLPGVPEDLKLANGYVYVALGAGGVAVVNATTLVPLSTQLLPSGGVATAVAVGPERLYVAAGDLGVVAYDLGLDHKTLTWAQTKTFSPDPKTTNLAVIITDVETRALPVGAGTLDALFVSANNYSVDEPGGVYRFDITTSPDLTDPDKSAAGFAVNNMEVADDFVFAAGEADFLALDTAELGGSGGVSGTVALAAPALEICASPNGNAMFLMGDTGMDVVDVTIPDSPELLTAGGQVTTTGVVQDLAAAEFPGDATTYLYLANGEAGVSLASAPHAAPDAVTLDQGGYLNPRPAATHLVAGTTGQAFVLSNTTDFWTADTSKPMTVTVAGAGLSVSPYLKSMTVSGQALLLSSGIDGLVRYNLLGSGDPVTPTTFSSIDVNDSAYEAEVLGSNAVVADGYNGLATVDLETMEVLTRSVPAPESDFQMVEVSGNYAYVADMMDNGATGVPVFRVYDLANAAQPVAKSATPLSGLCPSGLPLDMEVQSHFVFMACGNAGVTVVDVLTATAPALVPAAGYDTAGKAQSLSLYQNNLYVADGDAGVVGLSVASNGKLTLKASTPVSGSATQVAAASNGLVYVASGPAGFLVIQAAAPTWTCYMPLVIR